MLETPLHKWHQSHGSRMVEFGGWSMPIQYTTIVEEHHTVRAAVGLFDISHMGRLAFEGPAALDWLESVSSNQVAKLAPGQIQYSLITNESGGIHDDVLIYRLPDESYFMVCNASNREKVVAHLHAHLDGRAAKLRDLTFERAMIAVQGPAAAHLVDLLTQGSTPGSLGYYRCDQAQVLDGVDALISRTGYTGEDGFELIVPADAAVALWEALLERGAASGIRPCGLGARDTLRFEAAMPLYGHELSEEIDPFEAGLAWAVKLKKGEFVGRGALERRKAQPRRTRVGLALEGKRIARQGALVLDSQARVIGEVTSGTFAPTLEQSLAMALVELGAQPAQVDIRGHATPCRLTPLPFYRRPS